MVRWTLEDTLAFLLLLSLLLPSLLIMFIPSTFKRPVSSWKALNLRKTLLMASSVRLKPLNCSRLPCVYAQETLTFFCVSKNVSVSCAYTQGKREQFSGFNRTLDAINNVFRKFSAFHDETGRLTVDGMNIISNDGSNKLNRSRKARVSYKEQRTINASLNAATSTRAVSSNPNFVTRQKIEIIFGEIQNGRSLNELNRGQSGLETYGLFSNLTHDFLPISG